MTKLSAIAALAAQLCTGPLFWNYDPERPPLAKELESERCRGSEYFFWDGQLATPGAASSVGCTLPGCELYLPDWWGSAVPEVWEIWRCHVGGRFFRFDEPVDCGPVGATTETVWWPINDDPPARGRADLYVYRVRAIADGVRGPLSEDSVEFRKNPWPRSRP